MNQHTKLRPSLGKAHGGRSDAEPARAGHSVLHISRATHPCFGMLEPLRDAARDRDRTEADRVLADLTERARDPVLVANLPRIQAMIEGGDWLGAELACDSLMHARDSSEVRACYDAAPKFGGML